MKLIIDTSEKEIVDRKHIEIEDEEITITNMEDIKEFLEIPKKYETMFFSIINGKLFIYAYINE